MRHESLASAWVQLLSPYPWDWFATLTFRRDVHPEAAFKRFRFFISGLNRDLFGRHWQRDPLNRSCFWICAAEFQRRGVLHFHALVSAPGKNLNDCAKRLHYMDIWYGLAGIARIEEPRTGAVVNYCSKYVAKGGDIEISPNLRTVLPHVETMLRQGLPLVSDSGPDAGPLLPL